MLGGCAHYETRTFPTSTPTPTPQVSLPPSGGIDYQLGGAYHPPAGTAVVARDSTEPPAEGLYNICYLNGFQSQPGEAGTWPGLLLEGADGPVADPGWPDEYLFDTSSEANRDAIAGRMSTLIHACATAGYDAVEFDNLDSYSRSGGAMSQEDNLALAALYIDAAHEVGLAAAQKNSVEIAALGAAAGFDFAVTEQCGQYEECGEYEAVYAVVLDIEYADPGEFARLCAQGSLPAHTVRRDLNLSTPGSTTYAFERCPSPGGAA